MSTSFRQKLLNLLCSALLVCLVTASCAAVGWYTDLLLYETGDDSLDLSQMVGALGETLTIYCVLMSFVLFWHLWDLIGPSTRRARAITHLFGYSAFALILAALGSFLVLLRTGWFTRNSCEEQGGALYHECYLSVSSWVLTPTYILFAGLLALCVAKAAFVAASLIYRSAVARYAPERGRCAT